MVGGINVGSKTAVIGSAVLSGPLLDRSKALATLLCFRRRSRSASSATPAHRVFARWFQRSFQDGSGDGMAIPTEKESVLQGTRAVRFTALAAQLRRNLARVHQPTLVLNGQVLMQDLQTTCRS